MKTSLFTLVLLNHSIEDAIRLTAEIGYEGIEFRGAEPHLPPSTPIEKVHELRKLVEDSGLQTSIIASYTGGYTSKTDGERLATLDDLKRHLEFARILGTDLVRHSPGSPASAIASEEHWKIAAEWMQKAADAAEAVGCRLAMEIHNGGLVDTADSAKKMVDLVNRSNVGVIHDAGNMYITQTDFGRRSVEILGQSIFHVHVKDELLVPQPEPGSFVANGRHYKHMLLGEGGVDHRPAFRALLELGYQGYLSCEAHGPAEDQAAVARHEFDELRRQIAEVRDGRLDI